MDAGTCALQTGKDNGLMLQAVHRLEGAVTWQPGDQVSKFARARASRCLCVFMHASAVSGYVCRQCSFLCNKSFTLQQLHTAPT